MGASRLRNALLHVHLLSRQHHRRRSHPCNRERFQRHLPTPLAIRRLHDRRCRRRLTVRKALWAVQCQTPLLRLGGSLPRGIGTVRRRTEHERDDCREGLCGRGGERYVFGYLDVVVGEHQ